MKTTLEFLKELRVNNDREWFAENREIFRTAEIEFRDFTAALISEIHSFDESVGLPDPKDCIFRIYRDVRFSKNKEPYKPNFGAYIAKGGRKSIYAGYYIHIEAGYSFASGGIYMAEPPVMRRIRERIVTKQDEFFSIVENKSFLEKFGFFEEGSLKRVPQGFDKDSPAAEYLKMRHLTPFSPLSDKIVSGKSLLTVSADLLKQIRPLNDFLNAAVGSVK